MTVVDADVAWYAPGMEEGLVGLEDALLVGPLERAAAYHQRPAAIKQTAMTISTMRKIRSADTTVWGERGMA